MFQKGFAHIVVVVLFLGLAILGGGYILGKLYNSQVQNNQKPNVVSQIFNTFSGSQAVDVAKDGERLSNGKCHGNEKPKLTTLPMKYEDFSMIIPYGLVVGDHVTPIDHQYFSPTVFHSPRDTYDVYAMADALLVDVQPRVKPEYTEYRMVFSVSCKLFYYYDLVTSLAPDIQAEFAKSQDGMRRVPVNIPVKAGQVVGKIGGQTLDFAVWDMDVVLSGFVVPEHYKEEQWKIHTVDPLEYYTDELKQQALTKYIRTVPPISGKIDYDIDGKLIGNWFLEGTDGYRGLKDQSIQNYSRTHLAIVPNHIDPSVYIASFGDYEGRFQQFAIKNSSPDPKDVGVNSGVAKYDLAEVRFINENGDYWNGMSFEKNLKVEFMGRVEGCVLYQLLDARKLKMEAFSNTDCQSVLGFSNKATLYER